MCACAENSSKKWISFIETTPSSSADNLACLFVPAEGQFIDGLPLVAAGF
jgi:hypothetical protein